MLKSELGNEPHQWWKKTDETLLWQQFREGQPDAFHQLVRYFYRDLHFYGSRFTRDSDVLKDCLQDLFLDLWMYRHKIIQAPYIRPYLYKSLRRKVYREVLRHASHLSEAALPFEEVGSEEFTAEQALIHTELAEYQTARLNALLGQLSDRQREAIPLIRRSKRSATPTRGRRPNTRTTKTCSAIFPIMNCLSRPPSWIGISTCRIKKIRVTWRPGNGSMSANWDSKISPTPCGGAFQYRFQQRNGRL